MANKMSEESVKQLQNDLKKVVRLAKRKNGATGEELCKAMGIKVDFMGYRYRRVIKTAKDTHGLFSHGQGPSARWFIN